MFETLAGEQQRFLVCSETDDENQPVAAAGEHLVANFLSCCFLCKKRLQGKDIYMYRGEKAFCSKECRFEQIASDEFLNKKRNFRRALSQKIPSPAAAAAGCSLPEPRRRSYEHGAKVI